MEKCEFSAHSIHQSCSIFCVVFTRFFFLFQFSLMRCTCQFPFSFYLRDFIRIKYYLLWISSSLFIHFFHYVNVSVSIRPLCIHGLLLLVSILSLCHMQKQNNDKKGLLLLCTLLLLSLLLHWWIKKKIGTIKWVNENNNSAVTWEKCEEEEEKIIMRIEMLVAFFLQNLFSCCTLVYWSPNSFHYSHLLEHI